MGQLYEVESSSRMSKKPSPVKKSSSTKASKTPEADVGSQKLDLNDPKVQGVLLVGLLAVLALALWFGFTRGCLSGRRRRRRSCSCCTMSVRDQRSRRRCDADKNKLFSD